MNVIEAWRKADRLQRSRVFKIVATCVIAAIGVFAMSWLGLRALEASRQDRAEAPAELIPVDEQGQVMTREAFENRLKNDPAYAERYERAQQQEDRRAAFRAAMRGDARQTPKFILAIAAITGLAITIVWLGLTLTYALLSLLAAALIFALKQYPGTESAVVIIAGSVALTAAFAALMALARLAIAALPGPVGAIAQNVLAEAVRLKVSLVLIVLLVIALSAVPLLLNEQNPLRYRVQSFIQYGTGIAFWVLGFLTILLATGTVAFEQRDRIIWQTMTKPVTAWRYVMGKWLGVATLNLVLLGVCGLAIYLFTGHLASQAAQGEVAPGVSRDERVADDRFLLHSQVLSARVSVPPSAPFEPDDPQFLAEAEAELKRRVDFGGETDTPEFRRALFGDLYKSSIDQYRTIEPGGDRVFVFEGLQDLRDRQVPFTIRYKINAGSNRPDVVYKLTWIMARQFVHPVDVSLNTPLTIDRLNPGLIGEDGTLEIVVVNGDIQTATTNEMAINIPRDHFEITYSAGSFEANYARVLLVLWAKLAFMAVVGIACATFLSFPVAVMVTTGMLLLTETASFIDESVEYYLSGPDEGFARIVQLIVGPIAQSVTFIFANYGKLTPMEDLVQGLRVPWTTVAVTVAVLAALSLVAFAAGAAVFRSRELATYSGK